MSCAQPSMLSAMRTHDVCPTITSRAWNQAFDRCPRVQSALSRLCLMSWLKTHKFWRRPSLHVVEFLPPFQPDIPFGSRTPLLILASYFPSDNTEVLSEGTFANVLLNDRALPQPCAASCSHSAWKDIEMLAHSDRVDKTTQAQGTCLSMGLNE